MAKLKIENRYGIIPNSVLSNKELSFKAKGIYAYIQSKPENWDFAVSRIAYDSKDGRDGISSGIKELEDVWYLTRKKFKNEKGQWDIEYTLYDKPVTENPAREEEETVTDNPATENPSTENPETNKKRNTKKEISKQEYFEDHKLNDTYLEFIEHRKQLKAPMTELAITKSTNKLNTWLSSYKTEEVIEFINLAIRNGWKGIFEKTEAGGKKEKKLAYETAERGNFNF